MVGIRSCVRFLYGLVLTLLICGEIAQATTNPESLPPLQAQLGKFRIACDEDLNASAEPVVLLKRGSQVTPVSFLLKARQFSAALAKHGVSRPRIRTLMRQYGKTKVSSMQECNSMLEKQREEDARQRNSAPEAADTEVTTAYEAAVQVLLEAKDRDGDKFIIEITAQPAHGTLEGSESSLVYTPALGFSGSDSFQFVAHDKYSSSRTATVTLHVSAPQGDGGEGQGGDGGDNGDGGSGDGQGSGHEGNGDGSGYGNGAACRDEDRLAGFRIKYVDQNLSQDCLQGNYSIERRDCTGSDGMAYRHPQRSVRGLTPGDALVLREGTYATSSSSDNGYTYENVLWLTRSGTGPEAANSILITNYGDEQAVLDNGLSTNNGVVYIDGRQSSDGLHYIRIIGLELKGGTSGIAARRVSHITARCNTIHGVAGQAIIMNEQGGNFPTWGYHLIERNHIYETYGGMLMWGDYSTIRGNYVHHIADPDYFGNSDCMGSRGNYVYMGHNVMHDCGDDGIDNSEGSHFGWEDFEGPKFQIIENNVIYNTGFVTGLPGHGDGAGIKIDTYEPGNIPMGARIMRHNIIFNTGFVCFDISGNYRSLPLQPPMPNLVYNNTAFECGKGLAREADGIRNANAHLITYNNSSYSPLNGPFHDIRLRVAQPERLHWYKTISDFNHLGDRWIYSQDAIELGKQDPKWWDQNSVGYIEPGFFDPANPGVITDLASPDFGDVPGYHLAPESPLRNAGVSMSEELARVRNEILTTNKFEVDQDLWIPVIDYALANPYSGEASGSGPDIGAFEFAEAE